uniref:Uncharacterized protein n=1 Tax=Sphaeramia orbicularis TaxID=375764 RepID=A0A672Y821_9TELE
MSVYSIYRNASVQTESAPTPFPLCIFLLPFPSVVRRVVPAAAVRWLRKPSLPTMHVATKFLRCLSSLLARFVNTWFVCGGWN